MPVVRLHVPRRRRRIDAFIRNAPCAFNYIIDPIFVQCYVMGRFGHENGPFWMLAGAVLVFVFSSIGAVLVSVGRFRPSLGPFWRWAVLVGSQNKDAYKSANDVSACVDLPPTFKYGFSLIFYSHRFFICNLLVLLLPVLSVP